MHPENSFETFPASATRILLGSDNYRLFAPVQHALTQAGILVDVAPSYEYIEPIWARGRHDIVLVEVSSPGSVEEAVAIAMRLKRQDAHQFVGYLADPILHNHGLTGDAVFPRDSSRLAHALRAFFGPQL